MKKALSLILALILCLSLCACGDTNSDASSPTNSETTTPNTDNNTSENETIEGTVDEREGAYAEVIEKLNLLVGDLQGAISITEEDAKNIIEKLTELGDYKDSAEYLSRFAVLERMFTKAIEESSDNLGNVTKNLIESYTYDELGRITSLNGSNPTGPLSYALVNTRHAFEYNELGQISKITVYEWDNVRISAIGVPEYDDSGNMVALHFTTERTDVINIYTYDENGRCIASVETNDVAQVINTSRTYDENGNLLQEIRDYGSGVTTVDYTYDENGYLIQKTTSFGGDYGNTYVYTNDSQGRHLTAEYTSNDAMSGEKFSKVTYTYENIYFFLANN